MEKLNIIGLLVERSREFGRELCKGVIDVAQEHHNWEVRHLAPNDLADAPLASFAGFVARVTTPAVARRLAASGRPVVDVFYGHPDPRFAIVKERHESIGRLAAEHFLEHRFENFACCPFGPGKTATYCRAAFVQRLRRDGHSCAVYQSPGASVGYEPDDQIILGDRFTRPADADALADWLRKLPKPVAVFCTDDLRAWQVIELCRENGIDVPSQVAVLGLDNDLLLCGCTHPTLSSIDPNPREIGHVAARTLAEMIENGIPEKQIVRQVEPKDVVVRASTETYPLDPPWLSDALVYISHNAVRGISANDVFKFVGYSQPTVNTAFRRALNTTAQKIIAQSRLSAARHLLLSTDLSVTEVAHRTGYSSIVYFVQSFTDFYKIPPAHFRRQNAVPAICQ